METTKKMRIATTINTAGAILAYLIGAGFASGQETMQFFSNWGSVGGCFEIGVIFIVFLALTYVGVCYIGRTRNAADIKALYEVVGGKAGGKLLFWLCRGPERRGHYHPLFYAEVPGQKGRRREGLTAGDKTKGVSLWL